MCAVAKRDLKAGEILDDYGMYMTYGEAANVDEMSKLQYLPEGLVEGCKLVRDVKKDTVLTYTDVELPSNRLADRLRAEQYRHFRGETWLENLIKVAPNSRSSKSSRLCVTTSEFLALRPPRLRQTQTVSCPQREDVRVHWPRRSGRQSNKQSTK